MEEQEHWQLDGTAPELYERYLVPAITAMWAADLADRVALCPGERVLDVACGTGIMARVAAEKVGVTGTVDALDINSGMLAIARSLPAVAGATIRWHEASVLALPFADARFDVAFCQLGLQFFSDRSAALGRIRMSLVPDGRLALSVFGPIEHNPATHALANALDRRIRSGASAAKRAEHALANTDELHAMMTEAGFAQIDIRTARKTARFPSVADYVRIQMAATPLASLAGRGAASEDHLIEDVAAALSPYIDDRGLSFPQEVNIALARNDSHPSTPAG